MYSQSADNVLMEIATETGGKSFFANDDGSKTSINLFLAETAYRDCDTASTVVIYLVIFILPNKLFSSSKKIWT